MLASFATCMQFASPMSVARRVVAAKSSAALSPTITVATLVCSTLWLTYGAVFLKDVSSVEHLLNSTLFTPIYK
jgi:Sugar efflux transporter for intercellular exchange